MVITKRQLGYGFIVIGIVIIAGTFVFDGVRTSSQPNFTAELGPMQIAAIIAGGMLSLAGLTLLPFGDRPA